MPDVRARAFHPSSATVNTARASAAPRSSPRFRFFSASSTRGRAWTARYSKKKENKNAYRKGNQLGIRNTCQALSSGENSMDKNKTSSTPRSATFSHS